MTKTLIFMRPGHYIPFLRNGALTDEGRHQAEKMGFCLAGNRLIPDAIYHSEHLRAKETAEGIQKAFNIASDLTLPLFPERELTNENFRNSVSFLGALDNKFNTVVAVTHESIIESASEFISDTIIRAKHDQAFVLESPSNNWKTFCTGKLTRTLCPA